METLDDIFDVIDNQDDYILFGPVAREKMDIQAQYGSRYINPLYQNKGYPYLGEGLRIKGDPSDYHDVKIHQDDVELLLERYKEYKVFDQ